jgi:hypothetical protein
MDRRRQPGRRIRLLAIVAAILGAVGASTGTLLLRDTGIVGYQTDDLRRLRVA